MPYFNIVTESADSTVVTEYTPVEKNAKSYQTEAQLEAEFIHMLQAQGYEYLHIRHQDALVQNLRAAPKAQRLHLLGQRMEAARR